MNPLDAARIDGWIGPKIELCEMMKRFAIALLFGIIGYVVVAIAGYFLIVGFSSNMHDRTLEAAMTGAFVFGPLGAVTVFVITFVRVGSRSPGSQPDA